MAWKIDIGSHWFNICFITQYIIFVLIAKIIDVYWCAYYWRSHTVSIGQDLLDETKQIDPHKMMSRVLGTNLIHKQTTCGHTSYGSRGFINCYTCPLCSLGVMTSENDPQV